MIVSCVGSAGFDCFRRREWVIFINLMFGTLFRSMF